MSFRHLSLVDQIIGQADRALRTLTPGNKPVFHASPAEPLLETELSEKERRQSVGLMRVNHCGEVCAQGLYQGQAATAKLTEVRDEMDRAALEELDHLAWCEERLRELDSRPSLLNPLWYGLSFAVGAGAGLVSDKLSLGFVAATEEQVGKHLQSHLDKLPADDDKSRAIVEQMLDDEQQHGDRALQAGGQPFPRPVKSLMSLVSKAMTTSSYYL
ncbi:2-polyprenyl-3-methyl-6-methoxy-1,4-benzoquinone monooxygenase [Halioxenophilus sp. WMMB6]|uniref:2-polyprenyl-3-methyl-6-methoxy-1,4-benzoquinone monooxygenase n=1 Tax=Halioxenophilus sp. WMMB6 TaxID=3073815 RepID=UPI00295F14F5|nr:2-polyprenyl-3-methyl-6-methoxy-1,4-benzoquinone monooxygenase [Halioxenophilus sp. WMMB6]